MNKKQKSRFAPIYLSSLTLLSRIFGFLRINIITYFFGVSADADIINTLYMFPSQVRRLLTEGAFSSVFIPRLVSAPSEQAFRTRLRETLFIHWCGVSIVCLFGFFFSRQIVTLLYRFPQPEQMETLTSLFRWIFLHILFLVLPAVSLIVLHIKRSFIPGAVAPLIFTGAVILALLFFAERLGVEAFVIGATIGAIGQFLVHYIPYRLMGYSIRPTFHPNWRRIWYMLKRWVLLSIPTIAGILVNQWSVSLASELPVGSVSYLNYALTFFQFPVGIFTNSILTVFFPNLSEANHKQQHRKVLKIMGWATLQFWVLLIPSTLYMITHAESLLSLILSPERTNPQDLSNAARVLQYYAASLFPAAVYLQHLRYYIGIADTKKLLSISALFFVVDVVLSIILIRTRLGVNGLPIAFFVANTVCALVLLFQFLRNHKEKPIFSHIFLRFFQTTLVFCIGYAVLFISTEIFRTLFSNNTRLHHGLILSITGIIYSLVILGLYRLIKIRVLKYTLEAPK